MFCNEWEELAECDREEYRQLFNMFMCKEENSHDCEHCPYGGWELSPLPCGQQNCWVDAHCAAFVPDEDEIADVGDYDDMENYGDIDKDDMA